MWAMIEKFLILSIGAGMSGWRSRRPVPGASRSEG